MENLDILYEAFELFKNKANLDASIERFKKFYSSFKGEKYEDITLTYSTCVIESDWIEVIEKGLPFLEKAIKEERQFIRNDGEVLPIEKIRKISKDSIQDLAKHSNYITHEPEPGSDLLIPDKMLMIRKESDFAIYENRVLYAALVYLKDFVSSRLNKIKELTNRYEADTYATKRLDLGNRKLEYSFHLYETRNNDPIVSKKNSAADLIRRLDDIMTNILGLLKKPLMVEVSKSELVSRPITKTNILRMNHNFRESLACFDYIANYTAEGYQVKTTTKRFNPFSTDMMDSYGEVAALLSYLTYMYSNELSGELRNRYLAMLEKRKQEEEDKLLARLKSLKAKASTEEKTLTEYYFLFENGYRILEKRFVSIDLEIKELIDKHRKEVEALKQEHEAEIAAKIEYYTNQLEQLEQQKNKEISELKDSHINEITGIKNDYDERISSLRREYSEEKSRMLDEHRATVDELSTSNKELTKQNKELLAELNEMKTKFHALLIKAGEAPDASEIITEEKFDELEKTKAAFDLYYKKAWASAKKAIRQETLKIKKKEKK